MAWSFCKKHYCITSRALIPIIISPSTSTMCTSIILWASHYWNASWHSYLKWESNQCLQPTLQPICLSAFSLKRWLSSLSTSYHPTIFRVVLLPATCHHSSQLIELEEGSSLYGYLDSRSSALAGLGIPFRIQRSEYVFPAMDSKPRVLCSYCEYPGDSCASALFQPSFPTG